MGKANVRDDEISTKSGHRAIDRRRNELASFSRGQRIAHHADARVRKQPTIPFRMHQSHKTLKVRR